MKFILVCLMALFLDHQTILSQTYNIEYYKLNKVKRNNVTTTVSGNYGIFTTRVKQICYDSRSNGTMNYRSDLKYDKQSNGLIFYKGECYLDDFCYYVFNDSKGILNVSLSNGDVFVYHKASPPIGCKDGTYYGRNSGGGSCSGGVGTTNSYSSGTTKSSSSKSYQKTAHPRKCKTCIGRGTCSMCHGSRIYYVMAGKNSKYITCTHCSGSGKCQICMGSGTNGVDYY